MSDTKLSFTKKEDTRAQREQLFEQLEEQLSREYTRAMTSGKIKEIGEVGEHDKKSTDFDKAMQKDLQSTSDRGQG
jgi:hypothetical protein